MSGHAWPPLHAPKHDNSKTEERLMTNATQKTDLQAHVDKIASDITCGLAHECCPECGGDIDGNTQDCKECEHYCGDVMSGYDYLSDALDIQYIVNGDKEYIAARILVAFGGPNIWINTQTKTVEGFWWGESAFATYRADTMDIDGTCEELWGMK
jgi:hypothetical protein